MRNAIRIETGPYHCIGLSNLTLPNPSPNPTISSGKQPKEETWRPNLAARN